MIDKEKFPVGAKVRMKQSAVDGYYTEIQRRAKEGALVLS